MKAICSPRLPPPAGHYSPAIQSGNMLFISGQLPVNAEVLRPEGDLAAQAAVVFANIDTLLEAAGASNANLVNVQVYLADVALWPELNRLYAVWLGDHRPARTVVPCPALHYDALLEVSAVAAL